MKTVLKLMVGTAALATAHLGTLSGATHYVWLDSPDPRPPYTNWATAARVIQDAVDAAASGDEVVVTNGTYAVGGRAVYRTMTNRVAVEKPLTLRSVSGPQHTIIQGAKAPGGGNGEGAIRCAYLTDGANLSGFTLTNGATGTGDSRHEQGSGGGVWCASASAALTNCVLVGNSAGMEGGGTYGGTLHNCTLSGNYGSGAAGSTLYNCILPSNCVVRRWY
jgi:hypothetical protein